MEGIAGHGVHCDQNRRMMDHSHMKDLRLKKGLTQFEVARGLGIGLRTLRRYEKGETEIPEYVEGDFLDMVCDDRIIDRIKSWRDSNFILDKKPVS